MILMPGVSCQSVTTGSAAKLKKEKQHKAESQDDKDQQVDPENAQDSWSCSIREDRDGYQDQIDQQQWNQRQFEPLNRRCSKYTSPQHIGFRPPIMSKHRMIITTPKDQNRVNCILQHSEKSNEMLGGCFRLSPGGVNHLRPANLLHRRQ